MEDEKKLQRVEDEKENTKVGTPVDSLNGLPMGELIPVQALKIDDVDVNFQMEVTDASTSKKSENADLSINVTSKWFGTSASVQGKVGTSRENTRSTNRTAKYQASVSANQQQQTEGLSKWMDIMESCIEPLDKKE